MTGGSHPHCKCSLFALSCGRWVLIGGGGGDGVSGISLVGFRCAGWEQRHSSRPSRFGGELDFSPFRISKDVSAFSPFSCELHSNIQ